jgi:hypothetical protein
MKYTILIAMLTQLSLSLSQEIIKITLTSTIKTDGLISYKEWDDANSIEISLTEGIKIPVKFKRDNKKLYFLFEIPQLERKFPNGIYPEILLDIDNNKSSDWDSNDWWFNVSASDCFSQGIYFLTYGKKNTCKTEKFQIIK